MNLEKLKSQSMVYSVNPGSTLGLSGLYTYSHRTVFSCENVFKSDNSKFRIDMSLLIELCYGL